MSKNYIEERFEEIIAGDKFICTQTEFNEFQNYGYLLPCGDKFLTRNGKTIDVDILTTKVNKFDVNLSDIVLTAENESKVILKNKFYCMSEKLYKKYSEMGYIIYRDGKEFFRFFENELWCVIKY